MEHLRIHALVASLDQDLISTKKRPAYLDNRCGEHIEKVGIDDLALRGRCLLVVLPDALADTNQVD